MSTVNIAVVDDQRLFRQSLCMLIQSVNHFNLVIESENGNDFLSKLEQSREWPDIALVDIDMPEMNGIELNKLLRQKFPQVKVVILSVHSEERLIAQIIESGAVAYLAKNCDKDELITALQTVHQEGFYMNQQVFKAVQKTDKGKMPVLKKTSTIVKLTTRERQILQLICMEYSNTEIAEQLYLSVRTVEGHRYNLYIKTGCRNTASLVMFAVNNNLYIPPGT